MPKLLVSVLQYKKMIFMRAAMKKRYLYALLFIIPGFLLALPLSLNIFESLIAIYNTYGRLPRAYSEEELFYVLIAIFLITWVVLVLIDPHW